MVVWGGYFSGGVSDAKALYANAFIFAALLNNGQVKTLSRDNRLITPSGLTDVQQIFASTEYYSDSTVAGATVLGVPMEGPSQLHCLPRRGQPTARAPRPDSGIGSCKLCPSLVSTDGLTCSGDCGGYKWVPYSWYKGRERCVPCLRGTTA